MRNSSLFRWRGWTHGRTTIATRGPASPRRAPFPYRRRANMAYVSQVQILAWAFRQIFQAVHFRPKADPYILKSFDRDERGSTQGRKTAATRGSASPTRAP